MKIKVKQIFCAAMTLTAISAMAASSGAPMMSTNAAPMASTNSTDVMTQLFGDPVVAKGKGIEVKRSEVDDRTTKFKATMAASGRQIAPEQMHRVEAESLEQLIQGKLLLQRATAADRAEGKKTADTQLQKVVEHLGKDQFQQQLKMLGMTEDQFHSKMTDDFTTLATMKRETGANVTDAEVQNYYTSHPASFEKPETVHVRHILLLAMDPTTGTPLSDAKKADKRKQAEDILKRARGGEDFTKLAEEYSEDPGSKADGGDLPLFEKDGTIVGGQGAMVPQFAAAAFSLTNNQISDIVETEYGYHIIQSLGKEPAKKLTLTDKVPDSDETVADRLKDVLAQQKLATLAPPYLEKMEKESNVQILDPDLKASVESLKAEAAAASNAPAMAPSPESPATMPKPPSE